jgi:hypothetical protein
MCYIYWVENIYTYTLYFEQRMSCHDDDCMIDLHLPRQSVPITIKVVNLNPVNVEVYSKTNKNIL